MSDALEAAGLNVVGVLPRDRFDALVPAAWCAAVLLPSASAAVVLASGGRSFGAAFLASPEADDGESDPVDRFTARVVGASVERLRAGGHAARPLFYWERRDDRFADFVALARAAGMGAPSRLGLLLHPEFGPWLGVRAVVLTDRALAANDPLEGFDPCHDCPAPCTAACPVGAPRRRGFDGASCLETSRERAACQRGCDARRACPVGAEHAYAPEVEALHRAAALASARRG